MPADCRGAAHRLEGKKRKGERRSVSAPRTQPAPTPSTQEGEERSPRGVRPGPTMGEKTAGLEGKKKGEERKGRRDSTTKAFCTLGKSGRVRKGEGGGPPCNAHYYHRPRQRGGSLSRPRYGKEKKKGEEAFISLEWRGVLPRWQERKKKRERIVHTSLPPLQTPPHSYPSAERGKGKKKVGTEALTSTASAILCFLANERRKKKRKGGGEDSSSNDPRRVRNLKPKPYFA